MGGPSIIRAGAMAVSIVMMVGQAFGQSALKSEEERCRLNLAASRAVAGDSMTASRAYKESGSEADFCKMIPTVDRLAAAAQKAIKSCQRLYPQEMAKEQAGIEKSKSWMEAQRLEYAYRCNTKARAAIIACSDAAKDMIDRGNKDAIKAYASLHNQAPSSQTCADMKYLQTYVEANKAALKACRGAPGKFSDVDVYRQMIAKVSEKISEFRQKYPGACRLG
jgi:hypothetical protein